MKASETLEDQLRSEFRDLQRSAMSANSMGINPSETDQRLDDFDIKWAGRLLLERNAEIRGSYVAAREAVEWLERRSRQQENAHTFTAIRDLDPATRTDIWNSATRNTEPSAMLAKQRQEQIQSIVTQSGEVINQRYDALQDGIERGVDAIRKGEAPNLEFILDQQIAREAMMTRFNLKPEPDAKPERAGPTALPWQETSTEFVRSTDRGHGNSRRSH